MGKNVEGKAIATKDASTGEKTYKGATASSSKNTRMFSIQGRWTVQQEKYKSYKRRQ